MKAIVRIIAIVAAVLGGLTVRALNPIAAHVGPVRVFPISAAAAFGSEHASRNFNAITLSKDGVAYEPAGPNWVRFTDANGVVQENRSSDFSISLRSKVGFDGVILAPYRQFPIEAVEPLVFVAVGDPVLVYSRATGQTNSAKVVFISSSDYTVSTSYPAEDNDSGSVVTTPDGGLVGVVSASIREQGKPATGSIVTVPPISPTFFQNTTFTPGKNDPAPPIIVTPSNPVKVVTDAPIATLPSITPDEAYARGFAAGRAAAIAELRGEVEGVLLKLKALK